MKNKQVLLTLSIVFLSLQIFAQYEHPRVYSTFDNLPLAKSDTFDNGSDLSGSVDHYGRHFLQSYDTQWNSWSGWALTNYGDKITPGHSNQYSCIAGAGLSGTPNYMVGFFDPVIVLDEPTEISGMYITNSTYTYNDLKSGSQFSKKFGGDDGTDPDFLFVTVKMYLEGEFVDSSDFYLADFRFSDNSEDYILDDWRFWDFNYDKENDVLTDSLVFSFQSSDVGQFGINSPTYFCMDDFNAMSSFESALPRHLEGDDSLYKGVDQAGGFLYGYTFFPNSYDSLYDSWSGWSMSRYQDRTTPGFENQYSPIANNVSNSNNVFINYGKENRIRTPYDSVGGDVLFKLGEPGPWDMYFLITNTSYGYYDMLSGSSFSKKFGGPSGNDPDYFRLIMRWLNASDSLVHSDTIYLADFRSTDNNEDYILNEWIAVNSAFDVIPNAHQITFELQSSDTGMWGMNTPASFAMSVWYDIPFSIEEVENISIDVYPNPASETITIKSSSHVHSISLFSLQGTEILNSEYNIINVSGLTPGMYIVYVHTDAGIATKKIIVE